MLLYFRSVGFHLEIILGFISSGVFFLAGIQSLLDKILLPLDTIGAQLRAPLTPLNTIKCCDVRGVSGGVLIAKNHQPDG